MYDRHLEGYVRVVERGSFAKAAAELFITSTALIKQVNILERDVGVTLLRRTNRGVEPTPAGEHVYRYALGAIAAGRQAMAEARSIDGAGARTVRIATSQMNPARITSELWREVAREHPGIRLVAVQVTDDAREWARQVMTVGTEVDVIANILPGSSARIDPSIAVRPIYASPTLCALPPGHRLSGSTEIALDDLHGERVWLVDEGSTPSADGLRRTIAESHPQIEVMDYRPYDLAAINRISEGGAVGVVSSEWERSNPFLEYVPLAGGWSETVCLVYQVACPDAVKEFVDAVAECAARTMSAPQ